MKIRILAGIMLCALFLLLVTAACGNQETEDTFEVDFDNGDVTGDLGGYVMRYMLGGGNTQSLGYAKGTPLEDEALKKVSDLEKARNCTLEIVGNDGLFVTASASGNYHSDAVWIESDLIRDVAAIGGMVGISGLDAIDHTDTEKWGTPSATEVFFCDDDQYGVHPALWPEHSDNYIRSPIAVNENLIAILGVTDPRDFVETGSWTWDKLKEVLPLYYAEEGGEVKHYSWAVNVGEYAVEMILSNGGDLVEKNSAGDYVFCMYTDSAYVAMSKGRDILLGDVSYTIRDIGVEGFLANKAVLHSIYRGTLVGPSAKICNEMDNYGVIPFPVGPDADPHYKFSYYTNMSGFGIAYLAHDVEATASILNDLYGPIAGISNSKEMIDYFRRNYFFDDRDAENYITMVGETHYVYFHYGLPDRMTGYCSAANEVTQFLEANRNAVSIVFDKEIMRSIRGLNAVWGDGNY